jgi:hypothetical protein
MDCSCSVSRCVDDDDNHWSARERKARKGHKCYECNGAILAGQAYFYHTVFGGGSASNYKVCLDCQSVIWQFFNNGWWFGSVWDSLNDYVNENWRNDLPSSCICKLSPPARDKVCDIFDKLHTRQNEINHGQDI